MRRVTYEEIGWLVFRVAYKLRDEVVTIERVFMSIHNLQHNGFLSRVHLTRGEKMSVYYNVLKLLKHNKV